MWVNEGTPTMGFVLYTINVQCMCDASYVTWNYRHNRRYHVIFARKSKLCKIVVEPHYLYNKIIADIAKSKR